LSSIEKAVADHAVISRQIRNNGTTSRNSPRLASILAILRQSGTLVRVISTPTYQKSTHFVFVDLPGLDSNFPSFGAKIAHDVTETTYFIFVGIRIDMAFKRIVD
jgi:hypothetical protein